jgi:hypothetical protein
MCLAGYVESHVAFKVSRGDSIYTHSENNLFLILFISVAVTPNLIVILKKIYIIFFYQVCEWVCKTFCSYCLPRQAFELRGTILRTLLLP